MPDAPKIPADDDLCNAALVEFLNEKPTIRRRVNEAFEAGWRAAMAESKKYVPEQQAEAMREFKRYLSLEGF